MTKEAKAIELLQAADANCDDIEETGSCGVNLVKVQIQAALKLLGAQPTTTVENKWGYKAKYDRLVASFDAPAEGGSDVG